ncbi:MAG: TonB-dependent receptor plug domain-containing protein [Caulobacteraceae bacterium]|nr:TonB-dependent receptor plug domain-containing protein [Caulobacter sp.]
MAQPSSPQAATSPTTQDAAQNSHPGSSGPAAENGDTIPDIIVTANKREEGAQRVAATVAAVNQETLTREGVKNVTDLNRAFPEISLAGGSDLNAISIRGVGSLAFGPTTESPAAVHLDGAYVSRLTSLQALFYDVQRVEVLEGPQGTLYGRNSAAGTVNIVTNKPTQTFGGYGSLEYGNYDAITANAAINVPLTSNLAARFAYYHNEHGSYYNDGGENIRSDSYRLSLLWKPTAVDSFLFTADAQRIGGGTRQGTEVLTQVIKNPTIYTCPAPTGCPSPMGGPPAPFGSVSFGPAGLPGGVVVPITPATGIDDGRTLLGDLDQDHQTTNTGGYMGQYDHDFGWATLTAQASYRYDHFDWMNGSLTGYVQDPRLTASGVLRPVSPNSFENGNAQENTQEIRLVSPANQPISYVVGAFRFYEKSYGNSLGNPLTLYGNAPGIYGQLIFPDPAQPSLDIANPRQTDTAYAVFGQATWSPFGPVGLHLTAGIRYNNETKDATSFTILGGMDQGTVDGHIKNDAVTYKANISYDLTPHNLIYFDNSTGFAAGGFSFGVEPVYKQNTITAYEIGSKNSFLHDRLQVNLSAWHYNYRNLPTIIGLFYFNDNFSPPQLQVSPTTATAPGALVDGQSVSVAWRPTRDDIVSGSATHNDARFTNFNLYPKYAQAVGAGLFPGATEADYNYAGSKVGFSYDWSANAAYDHILRTSYGEFDGQVALHYAGKRLLAPVVALADTNDLLFSQPLATVDLSVAYRPPSRKWNLTAYVRNVGDSRTYSAESYMAGGAGAGVNFLPPSDPRVFYAYRSASYTDPRTFGLIARLEF